ncbi:hypothetical protein [Flectobacillus roseus]|uniref:hypothetical protein n=1 Tax=Flectobacillus roseus TaxID=502259 RepID=UPI0024B65BA9|nr:hypothetical protein [Flectobacillus roseus]MDI9872108.1 hypothetical protein [Flectobacillus roseus]
MNLIKKSVFAILMVLLLISVYPFILDQMIDYYGHTNYNSKISKINSTVVKKNDEASINNTDRDLISERGTFGDMYGLLNTLFSGVALVGLIITYITEKEKVREERKQHQKDKLSYFGKILHDSIKLINNVIASDAMFKHCLKNMEQESFKLEFEENSELILRLENRLNRINEEEYFVAYLECIKYSSEGYYIGTFNIARLLDTVINIPRVLKEIENELKDIAEEINNLNDSLTKNIHSIISNFENNEEILGSESYKNWKKSEKYLFDNIVIFKDLKEQRISCNVIPIKPNLDNEIREFEITFQKIKVLISQSISRISKKMSYIESDREHLTSELDTLVKFIRS